MSIAFKLPQHSNQSWMPSTDLFHSPSVAGRGYATLMPPFAKAPRKTPTPPPSRQALPRLDSPTKFSSWARHRPESSRMVEFFKRQAFLPRSSLPYAGTRLQTLPGFCCSMQALPELRRHLTTALTTFFSTTLHGRRNASTFNRSRGTKSFTAVVMSWQSCTRRIVPDSSTLPGETK